MNRLQQAIERNNGQIILGAAAYSNNPDFLEMAALMGFTAAWIEMEHTFITFAEAANLCRVASGLGMLTMIRIPDTRRETVAKASECGPDIIDLPMGNTPELLAELVTNARFPPIGARGFFGISRAVKYGIPQSVADAQQKLNDELCLMIQVETKEAVDRIEDLCSVPGVDAIFLGPADLSASLGVPGQTGHRKVYEAAAYVIQVARSHGKQVAVGAAPQDFPFWVRQKVDILYAINDLTAMKMGAQSALESARQAMEL
jgi:2-keto-3-deoxy-L-rhamnonate aldolase RhmA